MLRRTGRAHVGGDPGVIERAAVRGAAQNSGRAADGRFGRGNARRFRRGASGNPGGRPRGLARSIREQTKDGRELVAIMLKLLRDTKADIRLRMEAATWLADRAFGRPAQMVEHAGPSGEALTIVLKWGDQA